MADSFGKKEQIKKRLMKQREKEQKRAFKKDNNNKGKSLDEMIIYVDINGQFTDIPTHLQDRTEPKKQGSKGLDTIYTGVVNNVTDKGYGFIKEDDTKEQIFFHFSEMIDIVNSGNRVSFNKATHEGKLRAVRISKI